MPMTTIEIIEKYKPLFLHADNSGNIADNDNRRKLFGNMLSELRRATINPQTGKYLTQNDLAKIVDYKTAMSIQYIETGARPLPKLKIDAFAKALNVDFETLLDLAGYDKGTNQLSDGARFKILREQNGKSQRQVAKELNMATTSLARWENGKGQLSPENYIKIQSIDWIGNGFVIEKYLNDSDNTRLDTAATKLALRVLLHKKIDTLSEKQLEKLYKMIELLEE